MIGTDLTNARGAVRVCCALGCNVNKHVHGRSDICCMRRNPSHQRTQRKQCNAAARANYAILFALLNFFLSSLPSSLCPSIHPASQPATPKAGRQAGRLAGWLAHHAPRGSCARSGGGFLSKQEARTGQTRLQNKREGPRSQRTKREPWRRKISTVA